MADAVLNATQKRLLAEISATGLYPNESEILTTAFILAKQHSDKAVRLRREVEIGLNDMDAGKWEIANNPPPGSIIKRLVATHTAWSDLEALTDDVDGDRKAKAMGEFVRRVTNTAKRPTNLFARSCLPPATRIVFVWPQMAVVRFTPKRNELLRILHSSLDAQNVVEPEEG